MRKNKIMHLDVANDKLFFFYRILSGKMKQNLVKRFSALIPVFKRLTKFVFHSFLLICSHEI